ncbi:enoyl-CoA hydratase/isomerase family protein, partial [Pseudomonas taiwanensis]
MTTPSSSLLSKVEAGVAWITLNRPEQRNALDIPTLKQLHALLETCNSDPTVRVVVLT